MIKKLTAADLVVGMAHITGGGITENLPRILPKTIAAVVETGSWTPPPIFAHLQQLGSVEPEEMLRTFNMGIGLIAVVPAEKFKRAKSMLDRAGEKFCVIGRTVKGDRKVHLRMTRIRWPPLVSILISGSTEIIELPAPLRMPFGGINFLAIAEDCQVAAYRIAVVISNRRDAPGIEAARPRIRHRGDRGARTPTRRA